MSNKRIIKVSNQTAQLTSFVSCSRETLQENMERVRTVIMLLIYSEVLESHGLRSDEACTVEITVDYGNKQSAKYCFTVRPYTLYTLKEILLSSIQEKKEIIKEDFLYSLLEL